MKDIHKIKPTDINNLSPVEEWEQSVHHATTAVLELIRTLNTLPVEERQHITDMFNRIRDGKTKDV